MRDQLVDSRARWTLAVLCTFCALVLFGNRAELVSGMSSGFLDSIAGAGDGWWFFSHHLFFQPTVRVLRIILAPVGCDALCAGQIYSILWTIVLIASAFVIVLQLTRSIILSVLTGLALLFSHGIWVFATQIEPYAPLIGMNALLAAIVLTHGSRPWSPVVMAAVIAIFTFTLFLHQANIFFLIPLAIYLALAQGRQGILAATQVTAIAGIISLGVFVLVYWMSHEDATFRGFRLWLTYYGVVSDANHGAWEALLRLDITRLHEAARSVIAIIITEASDTLRKPVRIVVMLVLLLAMLANAIHILKGRSGGKERVFLLAWAAVFFLFFTWWLSGVNKFFLLSIVPLVILVALALSDMLNVVGKYAIVRWVLTGFAMLAIGLTAHVNYDRSVRPLMGDGSGVIRVTERLFRSTPDGCVLYTKRRFGGHLNNEHGFRLREDFRYYQMMYQTYHFGRDNKDIQDALGYSTDVKLDECNVVLLEWLSYEDFEWGGGRGMRRASSTIESESGGPNWPAFIAWILDARPAPDGNGIVHDSFVFYRGADDEAYVRIDRRREEKADSLDAVLDRIEEAILGDPRRQFTINEHESIDRFQWRVFGYS